MEKQNKTEQTNKNSSWKWNQQKGEPENTKPLFFSGNIKRQSENGWYNNPIGDSGKPLANIQRSTAAKQISNQEKPTLKMTGNCVAFTLLCSTSSPACHGLVWRKGPSVPQFPLSCQVEQRRPYLQFSNLSGRCPNDCFLCHLTQFSGSKKGWSLLVKTSRLWQTCRYLEQRLQVKHPTLAFSHRVQKSVLYICVSFSVLHIGSSLPSF